jgi:DNA-binding response OmpR family regulator
MTCNAGSVPALDHSCLSGGPRGRPWKDQVAARRVLLVEDEGVIRLMNAETLRDEGFDVVQAENGDEVISLLDRVDSFDVLFTDLQMPGKLDGIDVAVYARNRNPAVPVLVVSGVDAKRVMSRLNVLEPPAVFINKPYSPQEIVETVRRLAQRR